MLTSGHFEGTTFEDFDPVAALKSFREKVNALWSVRRREVRGVEIREARVRFVSNKKEETMERLEGIRSRTMAVAAMIVISIFFLHPSLAASQTVEGITSDSILIGMHNAFTGSAAIYSKVAELSEAMFLEYGKNINGRSIKVIKYDDGCDPVKGVAAAKKLIYEDKVFLINACACSNVALAVRPLVEKTGTLFFTQAAVANGIVVPTVKNIFNPGWVSSSASRTLADFAMGIPGVKKIGIIRHTDEWALALYKPLIAYLKEKYNVTPEVEVITERGVPDVTPQVLKLKSSNVDVVFSLIYIVETTAFLRDANRLGLDVPIMGGTATSVTDQYESLKSLAPLKKYFSPCWIKYPLDNPKVKIYEDLLKKYYPAKKFDAVTCYVTGTPLIIMDALKKAGRDLTPEKFIDILETQYNNWEPENFIGAAPITLSKTKHVGMDRVTMASIASGKFEIVPTYQYFD
jgi:branched-chain amino acid transport system substrate-binding protein